MHADEWQVGTSILIGVILVTPVLLICLMKCNSLTVCFGVPKHAIEENMLDPMDYVSLIKGFFNFGDFMSDLIFAMSLVFLYKDDMNAKPWLNLGYYSFFFCLVPYLISNVLLLYWFYRNRQFNIYVSKYLNHYDWFLIFLSAFCGFFSAIEISKSKLFYLDVFNLQIKQEQCYEIEKWRLINNVFLEDIPQLTIQFLFIIYVNNDEFSGDSIFFAVLAMGFSIVSVFASVFVAASRAGSMSSSNNNNNTNGGRTKKKTYKIQMVHDDFESYHRFSHQKIGHIISGVLGVDTYAVEVFYMYNIRSGLLLYSEISDAQMNSNDHGMDIFDKMRLIGDENHEYNNGMKEDICHLFGFQRMGDTRCAAQEMKILVVLCESGLEYDHTIKRISIKGKSVSQDESYPTTTGGAMTTTTKLPELPELPAETTTETDGGNGDTATMGSPCSPISVMSTSASAARGGGVSPPSGFFGSSSGSGFGGGVTMANININGVMNAPIVNNMGAQVHGNEVNLNYQMPMQHLQAYGTPNINQQQLQQEIDQQMHQLQQQMIQLQQAQQVQQDQHVQHGQQAMQQEGGAGEGK